MSIVWLRAFHISKSSRFRATNHYPFTTPISLTLVSKGARDLPFVLRFPFYRYLCHSISGTLLCTAYLQSCDKRERNVWQVYKEQSDQNYQFTKCWEQLRERIAKNRWAHQNKRNMLWTQTPFLWKKPLSQSLYVEFCISKSSICNELSFTSLTSIFFFQLLSADWKFCH